MATVDVTAAPAGAPAAPPQYTGVTSWMVAALVRHPLGSMLSLVAGWSFLWLALWFAVLGAFLGAIGGFVAVALGHGSGGLLGSTGGAVLSIGAVLGGAALGAVGGFTLIFGGTIFADPGHFFGSLLTGFVVTLVLVRLQIAYEPRWLSLSGYRRLSRRELRKVMPCARKAQEAMHLKGIPDILVHDTPMGAGGHGAVMKLRTMVLTKGLIEGQADQLTAVIAHELAHWHSGDVLGLTVAITAGLPLTLTFHIGKKLTGWSVAGAGPVGGRGVPGAGFLGLIGWVLLWPAYVLIKYLLIPVLTWEVRHHEYDADRAAKQAGFGPGLSHYLESLGDFETGISGWETTLAATHPPVELRLEALEPAGPLSARAGEASPDA
jgi:Zn-dependent protease with chaperone function